MFNNNADDDWVQKLGDPLYQHYLRLEDKKKMQSNEKMNIHYVNSIKHSFYTKKSRNKRKKSISFCYDFTDRLHVVRAGHFPMLEVNECSLCAQRLIQCQRKPDAYTFEL